MLKHGVQETTTTTGTGTITLVAISNYSRVADRFSVGGLMDYLIADANGNKEWGVGTVGASNTLARTTITGTLVGGVYTAGGAALNLSGSATVSCVEHEGSHKLLSAVSAPFVALGTQTDGAGVPTGVLVDEAGNALPSIRATIVPRTGTLASLLTLAGEVGEIASATDVDALVKFNGTANQAKTYWKAKYAAGGIISLTSGQSFANGSSDVVVDISSATLLYAYGDSAAAITLDATANTFTISAPVTNRRTQGSELDVFLTLNASATPGTNVTMKLQFFAGIWITTATVAVPVVANKPTSIGAKFINNVTGQAQRITLAHDDSSGARTLDGMASRFVIDITA